jgi:hypothetical protein
MRRPRPAILATVVVAAAVSLLAAGCGSSSPSSSGASSSAGHPTQAQTQQAAVAFPACMRSHGVPNFPDAPPSGPNPKAVIQQLVSTPQGETAMTACRHLLPNGGRASESPAQNQAHSVALLAFARCLRSHGFPNFPDPTSSGQVTHEMLANAGIDLQQPAVLQTADGCASVTHGVITRAVVARFVAGH